MYIASEYELAVNEVQVPVLNREVCNLWITYKELNVTDGMICAGYPDGGKDACQVSLEILQFLQMKISTSIFNTRTTTAMIAYSSSQILQQCYFGNLNDFVS